MSNKIHLCENKYNNLKSLTGVSQNALIFNDEAFVLDFDNNKSSLE